MANIDNMKIALFDEWSYDPPAGTSRYYYFAYSESYDGLTWPVDEIVDHLSECTYEEEELEELNEAGEALDKDGLTADDIRSWGWDNGGVGGECLLFAEGKDIINAIADYYAEELRDGMEEPYLDVDFDEIFSMDDDEEIEVEFDVTISLGKGDGGNVCVTVPVSITELKSLAHCAINSTEISDCDELASLHKRVTEAALDESEDIAGDLDNDEDFSNAVCSVSNPADTGDYNILTADYIVDYAKKHVEEPDALQMLLDLIDDFVESSNGSMW